MNYFRSMLLFWTQPRKSVSAFRSTPFSHTGNITLIAILTIIGAAIPFLALVLTGNGNAIGAQMTPLFIGIQLGSIALIILFQYFLYPAFTAYIARSKFKLKTTTKEIQEYVTIMAAGSILMIPLSLLQAYGGVTGNMFLSIPSFISAIWAFISVLVLTSEILKVTKWKGFLITLTVGLIFIILLVGVAFLLGIISTLF